MGKLRRRCRGLRSEIGGGQVVYAMLEWIGLVQCKERKE